MPDLYLSLGFLVVLTSAFIIAPLLLRRARPEQQQQEVNLVFAKQRLGEIKKELNNEQITEAEYQQLKQELELQLLQEQGGDDVALEGSSRGAWLLVAAVLLVPAASVYTYQKIGASADVMIKSQLQQLAQQQTKPSLEQLKNLQSALSQRIEQRPDNHNYRMLLAEMALQEKDYGAAIKHFGALVKAFPQDVQAQSYLTQAYYLQANEQITPEVQQQINRSLSLAPKQSPVLNLLAMHAFKQGDYQTAIDNWQTLLAGMPPNSQQATMMRQGIQVAKMRLGQAPEKPVEQTGTELLEVELSALDGALKNRAALVFVIVKAVDGPPMPLAVKRLALDELPAKIALSDADAMMPSLKLSQFKQLKINARVSESAKAQAGDWQSGWQTFELGTTKALELKIDQQL